MISIIVPVHNTAEWLPACLDSICAQTHRDFEALLAINASTDGSAEICSDYARRDPRLRVLRLERCGVSAARNLALEQARGEYLAFVDSDDWMEPNMLEALFAAVDGSGRDAAMCDTWNHDPDGRSRARLCARLPAEARGWEIDRIFLGRSGTLWNKLLGRACASGARFDEAMSYGEDICFLHAVAPKIERMAIVDAPLYNYRRRRPGSILNARLNPRYFDLIRSMNLAVDALIAHGCRADAAARARLCAGRVLRAAAGTGMEESAPYRAQLAPLLKKVRARWLLGSTAHPLPARLARSAQLFACRAAPAMIVRAYALLARRR